MARKKVYDFEIVHEIEMHPELFNKYYNKITSICSNMPYDFRKKLRYLRECTGFTREKLEESSYISVQTIKEIETNKTRGYSLETIIALCIGMKLPPGFSMELLRSGGFDIENNCTKKNSIYCYILRNLYDNSIDEVNSFLEVNTVSKLSAMKDNL